MNKKPHKSKDSLRLRKIEPNQKHDPVINETNTSPDSEPQVEHSNLERLETKKMIGKAVTVLNPEPDEPGKEDVATEKPKSTVYKRKEYGNCGT